MPDQQPDRKERFSTFTRHTLIAAGIVALALFLWQIVDALLLAFAGMLLAVFLRGLAQHLSAHTPLSTNWALAVVALLLVALFGLGIWLIGPAVAEQFNQLAETLPQTVEQFRARLQQYTWGEALLQRMETQGGGMGPGGETLFSRATGVASTVLSVLTNLVLILFTAIFFAVNPGLYKHGLVLLVPESKSDRVQEALDTTGRALWKWLMGKLVAMLFIGVSVTLGLSLLGVPLALALGVMAGLFDFVPFIGPLAAAVPGVLLALTQSPATALYAALVYLAAQQLEGNLVTPLVQQRAVSLPPVLVLLGVVASGLLFGLVGILLAEPLVVTAMVLVKMLYIEDVLGKSVDVPGREEDQGT